MRPNKLRELLNAGKPTIGTHIHSTWPSVTEVVGHTGMFDYIEFVSEYAPFDLYALENVCRAAELHNLSSMIKVDQQPRRFLSQRAIGAGFQSVLFADCRKVEDFEECVRAVRPETPEDGGVHGVGTRRATYMLYGGTPAYVENLRNIVVAVMIEKKGAVENLDEVLAVKGIDMVQWGPADYAMSIGRPGQWYAPEQKGDRAPPDRSVAQGGHRPPRRDRVRRPGQVLPRLRREAFLHLDRHHDPLPLAQRPRRGPPQGCRGSLVATPVARR